ncbi:hypothetical protein Acr_04g0002440 [Actinidia rufa]|uniref:Uncharacterized protein n=1 Tax=Actinidia rufa TaxID=165716 RepID=A0A7J0EH55_9ERIC|nr:hypothetical protein Acr_04g0002440 [Actinidia rufa]
MLNRNRGRVIPSIEPAVPTSISSSKSEHPSNLAHTPPRFVGKVEIAPTFRETNNFDCSSRKANTMRFRNLRKKITSSADLPSLAKVIMGVDPDSLGPSLLEKCKGKELIEETSRRTKRRARKTSSGASTKLWKLEFSTCELNKEVTVADSAKDYDISMALARSILLLNDVATLNKTLAKAALVSPMSYYPLILPGFDELEYVNRPKEGENATDVVVPLVNEAANLTEVAEKAAMEESVEGIKEEAREDVAQDPPRALRLLYYFCWHL